MLSITLTFPALPYAEAANLAQGAVSPRIQSLVRKQLLAAKTDERLAYRENPLGGDGRFQVAVYLDGTLLGQAYSYDKYWQIHIRNNGPNIRRSNLDLLKEAIRHYVEDKEHASD